MSPYSNHLYGYESSDSHTSDYNNDSHNTLSSILFFQPTGKKMTNEKDDSPQQQQKHLLHPFLSGAWLWQHALHNNKTDSSSQPQHPPRSHRSDSSSSRLVADPFLRRTYGQTNLGTPLESVVGPPRADSTRRAAAPVLHQYYSRQGAGVPDSDSTRRTTSMQDSVSRPSLSTKRGLSHKKLHANSSRVSNGAITPSHPHKSSNFNNPNHPDIINNMTPQVPFHHEDSLTTVASSAAGSWDDAQPPQRPRSRNIAIVKRHRKNENDFYMEHNESPSDTSSSERMYDWATWCMYNRIIDHRRNSLRMMSTSTPIDQASGATTSSSQLASNTSSSAQYVLGGNGSDLYMHGYDSQESHEASPWDYCHDGEVFELEI